jgi:hypothetical protein
LDPTFELAWMTILQYELDEKLTSPELVQILGPERVMALLGMTPQRRFTILAQAAKFKCRGLRGVTARNRTLTKIVNLLQLMENNPALAQAILQKYSMQRMAEVVIRNSGVDPSTLEKTQEEKDQDEAQAAVASATAAVPPIGTPGGSPPAPGAPPGGPPGAPPSGPPAPGGSPPALTNASMDQMPTGAGALAPKTPGGQIPGAPQ